MTERHIRISTDDVLLAGDLRIPLSPCGVVLFAHGSGSSRLSSRNQFVARELNDAGLATLLMDLLTPEEEQAEAETRHLRFDIGMLSDRLGGAVTWLQEDVDTRALPVGTFGASTGAAAALCVAERFPDDVRAVVSRGGRPDLAGGALERVQAPTLLIVGSLDALVIELNEQAMRALAAPTKALAIVPGASHLFGEPGTLEEVARLAREWFLRHLCGRP